MPRIRPLGQCEECPSEEGLKEIVSHGLCAKHNQRRLRANWRKPQPSETQKQKLMEKLEKDLIAIKNMCAKWERDGYVAMELITAETIETFRMELSDYMDFRPTLEAAQLKTELDEALKRYKVPPPMWDDEDPETASKKSAPGQYQMAPVVEKSVTPMAATAAPKQAKEAEKSPHKDAPKANGGATEQKADEPGVGTTKAFKEAGWTFKKRGDPKNILEITEVDYGKRELKVAGSKAPVPFGDVLFLTDPENPDRNLSSYFSTDNPGLNEALVRLDRVEGMGGKPPQAATTEAKKKASKKSRIHG
jgi:hypothetical protein